MGLVLAGMIAVIAGIPLIVITRNDYKRRASSSEYEEGDTLRGLEEKGRIINPYKAGILMVLGGSLLVVYGLLNTDKQSNKILTNTSDKILKQVEEIANIGYNGYDKDKDYNLSNSSLQVLGKSIAAVLPEENQGNNDTSSNLYTNYTNYTNIEDNYIDISSSIMDYISEHEEIEEDYREEAGISIDPGEFYKEVDNNTGKFSKDNVGNTGNDNSSPEENKDGQEWNDPLPPPDDPDDYVSPDEVDKINARKAAKVDRLIRRANNIPTLDEEFPKAVKKARIAYDLLEQSQKYLVTEYNTLVELEDWVKEVEAGASKDNKIDQYIIDNNIDPPETGEDFEEWDGETVEQQSSYNKQYKIISLSAGGVQEAEDTGNTDTGEDFIYGQLESREYAEYMISRLGIDSRVKYKDSRYVIYNSSLSEDEKQAGRIIISINKETIEIDISSPSKQNSIVLSKGNADYKYSISDYSIYDNGQVRVKVSSNNRDYLFVAKIDSSNKLVLSDETVKDIVKDIQEEG